MQSYVYLWLDIDHTIRSKIRILPANIRQIPSWEQKTIVLHPQRMYTHQEAPRQNAVLVLCEASSTWSNARAFLRDTISRIAYTELAPSISFEQHYNGTTAHSNSYDSLLYDHVEVCMQYGIHLHSAQVDTGGLFVYTIGPRAQTTELETLELLEAADDLVISRYLLLQTASKSSRYVSFHPKPFSGCSAGCHVHFSTAAIRAGVFGTRDEVLTRLSERHVQSVPFYGIDNHLRLTDFRIFVFADRIEDHRPGANCNPYLVCNHLLRTASSLPCEEATFASPTVSPTPTEISTA